MREWASGSGAAAGGGGVKPVFVLVDFYDHGPAVETADRVNGIVPVGRVREPGPELQGGGERGVGGGLRLRGGLVGVVVFGVGLGVL
jgi:hypothetical protein